MIETFRRAVEIARVQAAEDRGRSTVVAMRQCVRSAVMREADERIEGILFDRHRDAGVDGSLEFSKVGLECLFDLFIGPVQPDVDLGASVTDAYRGNALAVEVSVVSLVLALGQEVDALG